MLKQALQAIGVVFGVWTTRLNGAGELFLECAGVAEGEQGPGKLQLWDLLRVIMEWAGRVQYF